MKDPSAGDGTVQALLERLNDWRLPRALDLKQRVDAGEKLNDHDLKFLQRVFEDANQAKSLVASHKELQPLVNQLIGLYSHITQTALENEKAS
jgi:hypothetical protein